MIPLNEKVWSGRLQAVWILLAAAGTAVQFEIDSSGFTTSSKLSVATLSAAVCSFILLSVVAHILFNPDVPHNRRLLVVALTICGYMIVFSFHFHDHAGVLRNLLGAGVLFYLIWHLNESTPTVNHQRAITSFSIIFYISVAAILSMPFGVIVELTHLKRGNTIGAASVGVFSSFIIAINLRNRLFGPHTKFSTLSIRYVFVVLSIAYLCCLLMGIWLINPNWFQPSGQYIVYKLVVTTSFFIITIGTAFVTSTHAVRSNIRNIFALRTWVFTCALGVIAGMTQGVISWALEKYFNKTTKHVLILHMTVDTTSIAIAIIALQVSMVLMVIIYKSNLIFYLSSKRRLSLPIR